MRQLLRNYRQDQSGATSIEYGLIAGLIFVVVVGSIVALGDSSTGMFARVKAGVLSGLDSKAPDDDGGDPPAEGEGD